jgi:polyphosphate kinase 2 (PPK2 family)
VLVERIEGFASEVEWGRAYGEIADFESQLFRHGHVVMKFWLHVDRDEQLRRFQAREKTPYKKYKLTEEDYRNREKWPDYCQAVHDMVVRTSTERAPWHLIAANDKRWARIEVLRLVCERLERHLDELPAGQDRDAGDAPRRRKSGDKRVKKQRKKDRKKRKD